MRSPRRVIVSSAAECITVTLAMSGEGETWVDQNRVQLSPDGNVLTGGVPAINLDGRSTGCGDIFGEVKHLGFQTLEKFERNVKEVS